MKEKKEGEEEEENRSEKSEKRERFLLVFSFSIHTKKRTIQRLSFYG